MQGTWDEPKQSEMTYKEAKAVFEIYIVVV